MNVSILSHDASDLHVVNAARVSYGKSHTEFDSTSDTRLINFLMRSGHGSPFEHCSFRFYVTCPFFIARQWFKHRIGSFNEISGRWTEVEEEFWWPTPDELRGTINPDMAGVASATIREAQLAAFRAYHALVGMGVSKEQARTVVPLGAYTEFHWSVNARSLMNYIELRTREDAQPEHQVYACDVETLFSQVMPVTHAAFVECGKKAP